MKLFWTGTDSLMLIDYSMRRFRKRPYWFLFRILVKGIDPFIECHYCDSEQVANNVKKFGTKKPVKVFHDKLKYNNKYPKKAHDKFNIIYYNPTANVNSIKDVGFTRWLYGLDIIEEIKEKMSADIEFIELDGTKDLKDVYPITDMLLRPNRHDGASRMRQECDIQNIPYYWTTKETDFVVDDVINYINKKRDEKRDANIHGASNG